MLPKFNVMSFSGIALDSPQAAAVVCFYRIEKSMLVRLRDMAFVNSGFSSMCVVSTRVLCCVSLQR